MPSLGHRRWPPAPRLPSGTAAPAPRPRRSAAGLDDPPDPDRRRPRRHGRGPGFAVHHLGASWTGRSRPAGSGSATPTAGTAWQPLLATDSGETGRHRITVLTSAPATAYEVEPAAGVDRASGWTPSTPWTGRPTGAPRDRVRRWSGLTYLSRAGWGADESLRFEPDGTEKFPTAFFDVQTLTVHHTVTANSRPRSGRDRAGHLLLPLRHLRLRRHRLPPADRPGRHGLRGPLLRARPAPGLRAATGRAAPVDGQRGPRRRLQRRQRRRRPAR